CQSHALPLCPSFDPSCLFFLYCASPHRPLHSFPTRRSSDLSTLNESGISTPRTAGTASSVRVKTLDVFGNMASSYRGTIHFTSRDRKSTRLNSRHVAISYAVFCLKKKNSVHRERVALASAAT